MSIVFKGMDTIGNCQRLAFTVGVSQHMHKITNLWGVVAEWIRAPNSSSDASVQQSVGSNPGHDNCVPEPDT